MPPGLKILHGTSTVSLQSTRYLADALTSMGHQSTILVYRGNPLLVGFEDVNLEIDPQNYLKYPWYLCKILYAFFRSAFYYDVFHFHFGYSLLPQNLDLWLLKRLNKKVFMEYHGSEVRRESVYAAHNPDREGFSGIAERESYKKQKRVARHVDGIMVHDRELADQLYDFPVKVFQLPLRIDLARFTPSYPRPGSRLRIVHSPSRREVKGTAHVIKAVETLSLKYDLEFILVAGRDNREAKKLYQSADIVVDQLLVGTYGMLAIECMAYGKPTVCHLRDDLLDSFPEKPPLHNANPDNLERRLEELIIDFDLRRELGRRGRRYVEKYHCSKVVARQVIEIYNS